MTVTVNKPAHAYTKLQTQQAPARKPVCAWCHEDYILGDVIPWRSLAGDLEDTKIFHPECLGEMLHRCGMHGKFDVADQLGIPPREVA